ncbi:MAG TPA: PAS domain S-box protein [Gemmatimonadota bacterium]|nr:PAS domain S-box protein [Gemmatimonadota bacterium]
MDLRTKLVFVLVGVGLASMLALGTLAYSSAEDLIEQRSSRSLASLAEAKAERVESVVRSWEDAVSLLSSRTQLRRSLASWNASPTEREREAIYRILADAQTSSDLVDGIAVYAEDAALVAVVGPADPSPDRTDRSPHARVSTSESPVFLGFTDDRPPRVFYRAPLIVDSVQVGSLEALLSTRDLLAVAANRTGLLDTGEALIASVSEGSEIRLLTPLRHDSGPPDTAVAAAERMMAVAMAQVDDSTIDRLIDYRGQAVWAAFRRIDEARLGLLVKFDESEERADVIEFRDRIIGVGFSLAAFAILAGVAMAFAFAKPINELAAVARRIHDGDLAARADADREDELGLLAETFNAMSEKLERRLTELEEFKTFFDESRDMQCVAGTDGYFKRVNPAFERNLGWSENELLGRPFVDFVHPDDVQATIRETEEVSTGRPTISFSNRYLCKDGSYRRLRWTAHPDPATGNIYASARSPEDAEGA